MARVSRAGRPLRISVLVAFLLAGLAATTAEILFLPDLGRTPLYFGLTVATTAAVAVSLGLGRSGLRSRLPVPLRLATTTVVALLSAASLLVLGVLPYWGGGSVRHDRAVTFAVPASAPAITAAEAPAAPPPPAPPPARSGPFNHGPGPDTVSGQATLGRTPDGLPVLRLEGLEATPGPDLYVYLTREESPAPPAIRAGVLVSALKTYRGDFTFALDPGLDLEPIRAVAVYCRSFNVVFGYANLR